MDAIELPTHPARFAALRQGAWLVLALTPVYAIHSLCSRLLANEARGLPISLWGPTLLGGAAIHLLTLTTIVLILGLLHPRLPKGGPRRWLGLVALTCVATAAAWSVFDSHFCQLASYVGAESSALRCRTMLDRPGWLPLHIARQLQPTLLLLALLEFLHRSHQAAEALHEARLRRLRLDARLAEGRLRLLQAQIEPHFLFNTLANVRRLLRTDASGAATMLVDLRRYLQEALPRLREPEASLADEVELVRAYLAVHAVRMGERLRYRIELPAELAAQRVPSMGLLTLVENAIKHGLAPLPEGGSIEVVAERTKGQLKIHVADSGRGMSDGSGHGLGLANLRARLRARHGEQASLQLHLNEPCGMCATLTLPLEAAR